MQKKSKCLGCLDGSAGVVSQSEPERQQSCHLQSCYHNKIADDKTVAALALGRDGSRLVCSSTAAAAAWALAFYNQVFAARARGERVSIIGWLAVGVAAALSIFSSFSGLCLLLLLPVLAMMHRASSRIVIAMAVVMAIGLLAYLSGPFASSSDWAAPGVVTTAQYVHFLLSVAAVWLQWSGLYFGSPLSRALPIAGFVFAYGSLFYLVWQAWRVLRDSASSITAFRMTMLSIAWWAAIVGIATGLGRMYFVHTAPEDRYQSIVLIYWLGVFSAAFAHARARVSAERVVLAIILFWTLVVLPLASWAVLRFQVNFFDRVKDANVAIATGQWDFDDVKDTLILGDKWKKISRPQMYGEFLRAQRWGVFADPAAQQLGQTLNAAQIDLAACDGEIYNARWTAAPYHGLRLQGRGLNRELKPFEQLVIVDESNRQIGLARLQRPKDFLWPITWQDAQASHWLGYTLGLSEDVKNARVLGAYRANGFVRYCPVANQPLPLASPGESAK